MATKLAEAVAYLRTSSATNAGPEKDSERRQRETIAAFAKRAGFALVGEFSDPGVSGADPIAERPGFAKLLDRIEGNGVRVVIVEDASRFARELMTQELRIIALVQRGVRVLTANGDDLTDSSDLSRKMTADRRRVCRVREGTAYLEAAPHAGSRQSGAGPL